MQIRKILKYLLICVFCAFTINGSSFAAGNMPFGDIGDFGAWVTEDNMGTYREAMSADVESFQKTFQSNIKSSSFVPIEVRLGLEFMKALSSIDSVLQMSLVRFTIIFLFLMYACWVGLEAYRLIKESSDYKKVLYDIFTKGATLAAWVIILDFGPAKIFSMLITPIISLGVVLSDFILNSVAKIYDVSIPDTCEAVRQYVANSQSKHLLINADTAANIMCLPARLSVYFYKATGTAFHWIGNGFKHIDITEIIVGIICVVMFIKCIFKYAFMTLGIVADLFLTLLMLPFTAIAECLPESKEKNYAGQVFSGFLKMFNTRKLSDVISTFINTTVYFISLAIVISICAALLNNIVYIGQNNDYMVGSAMVTILCGALIFYLADQTDKIASDLGGKINNAFGKQIENDTKTIWGNIKGFGGNLFKAWLKEK